MRRPNRGKPGTTAVDLQMVKGATSPFEHLKNLSLIFSSSSFVTISFFKRRFIVNHLLATDPVISLSFLVVSCNNLSLQKKHGKVKFLDCILEKIICYGYSSLISVTQ